MYQLEFLRLLSKGNKTIYDADLDKDLAFVQSFEEPQGFWQRSFFQYKCHQYHVPCWKRTLFAVTSCFLLPFAIVYLRLSRIGVRFEKKEDAICENSNMEEIIPLSVKKSYKLNCGVYYSSGFSLSHSDLIYYLRNASAYLLYPTFLLHIVFKIGQFSMLIKKYQPNLIICHNEYSYASSVLTDYCHFQKVKHFNMMHGERLLNIRATFFQYDKCYVWHEHYKNLYIDLRAEPSQFVIEVPPSLQINVKENYNVTAFADYKYYLAAEKKEDLIKIINSLKPLKERGYKVKYRPHPRYSSKEIISELFSKDEIEVPSEVNILTSVSSCNYAIGSSSTVLLQAFLCGKGVLLDDVTYPDRIPVQRKARYILLSEEGPELLTEHIQKLQINSK